MVVYNRPVRRFQVFVVAEAILAVGYFASPPSAVKVIWYTAVSVAPAVAIVVGVRSHRPSQPLAWYLLAAGQSLFAVGDAINNSYVWVRHTEAPFPALADLLYLAFFPSLAAGLLLLIRAQAPRRDRASLVDAVIVATGVGLVSWEFLIVPNVRDPGLTVLQRLVSVTYPLADVLLLAIAVRLWRAGGNSLAFRMLVAGLFALLTGDAIYGLRQLTVGWTPGGPLDLIWMGYYLGLGGAALHPSMRSLSEPTDPRPPRLPRPRRVLLTGATLMAPATLVIQSLRHEPVDLGVNAAGTAILLVLLTGRLADLAGETARQQERERSFAGIVAAAQQERRRLAADLHDGPVQELTAVLLRLERIRMRLDAGDLATAQPLVKQQEAALRAQVDTLRGLLAELWPPAMEQHGLAGALRLHAQSIGERAGLNVDLDLQVDQRLPSQVEATVYRVVQEALTNVAKHAKARNAWVRLAAGRDGVRLLVRDDGAGFDPAEVARLPDHGHYGIASMRERVEMLGGRFELSSGPEEGTLIRVTLDQAIPAWR